MRFEKFGLERFFARHEFVVKHMLTASDPETMSVRELLALDGDDGSALLDLRLGYSEPRGLPALRRAIASLYERTPDEAVMVCAGAQEPILLFALAALEPGDEVIVQTPCYQSLSEVMRWTGATVVPWRVHESEGWQLDPERLPTLVTQRTKALVVNVPHNPTGAVLEVDRWRRLMTLAERAGLWVLSDEAYRGLELDGPPLPAACDVYERAVSTGALAKGWGLGGLRIGWCATRDEALLARMEAAKDYTTICSPSPSEVLAEVAVRHSQAIWARTRARIAAHRELFAGFLERHEGLSWVPPAAGTMGFMRVHDGHASAFADKVLADAGVLLAPGPLFLHDDTHLRVGLGRVDFPSALAALEGALAPKRTPRE